MAAVKSAGQPQLLFVDGTPEELAKEMADYLKSDEAKQLLAKEAPWEEVLSKLVTASQALSTVAEKEYTAASNLMIHLVLQSSDPKKHLPTLCGNLAKPPLSNSPVHGPGLSLNALATVFNLLEQEDPIRARVFMEIVKFLKAYSLFDSLRPYLDKLPDWIDSWDCGEDFERKMYEEVADAAVEAGEDGLAYDCILKALRTFDDDDKEQLSSEDAQRISLRAVKMAISSSSHFLFQDIRAVPSVQALSESHPIYTQLLDIFAEQDLEDYNDFNDEHKGWIEQQKLDAGKLQRKMRLLTFASLAATTPSREIEYARIVKALQIGEHDVEMWAIDVIRAGLVEGKLSQKRGVFLVHKVTYRVFGQRQYQELATRVDHWRGTLHTVLGVLKQEHDSVKSQREREMQDLERKMANAGLGQGMQGRRQQRERTDNDD